MSTIETVLAFIQSNPGSTSTQICDANPQLVRATITSAISKLKKREDVWIDDEGALFTSINRNNTFGAETEYPSETDERKYTETEEKLEPLSEFKPILDKEVVLSILKPFAEYGSLLRKLGLGKGHPYVLMSGTTETSKVVTADGTWFLDAEDFYTRLLNS